MFFLLKNNDFEGSGGSKIYEQSVKNRLKNEAEDGVALGLDFIGFGWIWEAKLGGKSFPKTHQK